MQLTRQVCSRWSTRRNIVSTKSTCTHPYLIIEIPPSKLF